MPHHRNVIKEKKKGSRMSSPCSHPCETDLRQDITLPHHHRCLISLFSNDITSDLPAQTEAEHRDHEDRSSTRHKMQIKLVTD